MPTIKPDTKCKNDKNLCMVFNLKCCDHKTTKCDNFKVAVYRSSKTSSELPSADSASYHTVNETFANQITLKARQNQQQKLVTQPKSRIRSCTDLVKKIRDMLDDFDNNKIKPAGKINLKSNHTNDSKFQILGETGSNKSNFEDQMDLRGDLDSLNRKEFEYVYDLYQGNKKISQNNSLAQIMNDKNIEKLHESLHENDQIHPSGSSLHSSHTRSTCIHNIFNSLSHKSSERSQSLDLVEESINEDNLSRPSDFSMSQSKQTMSHSQSASERLCEANKTLTDYQTESEWRSVSKSLSKSTLNKNVSLTQEEKMSNISSIRSLKTDESQLTSNNETSNQSNSTSYRETSSLITSSDNRDPLSQTSSRIDSSNRTESELKGIDSSYTKTMSSVEQDKTANKSSREKISENCSDFVNQKRCEIANAKDIFCCCPLPKIHQHCCAIHLKLADNNSKITTSKNDIGTSTSSSCTYSDSTINGSDSEKSSSKCNDCSQQQQQQQQNKNNTSPKQIVYHFNIKL